MLNSTCFGYTFSMQLLVITCDAHAATLAQVGVERDYDGGVRLLRAIDLLG